jgi:hypothetical protein
MTGWTIAQPSDSTGLLREKLTGAAVWWTKAGALVEAEEEEEEAEWTVALGEAATPVWPRPTEPTL